MPATRPAAVRFAEKVNFDGPIPDYRPDLGPCHLWTAGTDSRGYGAFSAEGRKTVKAYAWAWEQEHGPVPVGLELDHLCRVRLCVRTSHLEPVTHGENIRRGHKATTHCRRGHDLTDAPLRPRDGARLCRECAAIHRADYQERQRARLAG